MERNASARRAGLSSPECVSRQIDTGLLAFADVPDILETPAERKRWTLVFILGIVAFVVLVLLCIGYLYVRSVLAGDAHAGQAHSVVHTPSR